MLDNLSGSSEAESLQMFEAALSEPEPQEEPTEEPEEVELSDQEEEEIEEEPEEEDSEGEEESETEEDEEEQAAYEVIVDGQSQEVTLDELLSGYQRQADYTRKTQAVSDQRKQLEAQSEQVSGLVKELEASQKALAGLLEQSESAIDWDELRETNPSEYLRQKELQEQRAKAVTQAQSDAQKAKTLKAQEEGRQLFAKIPTWKDDKQRNADKDKINAYLSDIGFAENEYTHTDHRLILALYDAARYRELQSKSASVVKKVKKAPKVTKPGKKLSKADIGRKDFESKMSKFSKSGREEDGLEVFKQFV